METQIETLKTTIGADTPVVVTYDYTPPTPGLFNSEVFDAHAEELDILGIYIGQREVSTFLGDIDMDRIKHEIRALPF